jgi:hypothetical protein
LRPIRDEKVWTAKKIHSSTSKKSEKQKNKNSLETKKIVSSLQKIVSSFQ